MYRQSEKNLLSSNVSSTCPHNMVNFGTLAAEIVSLVWGTPENFNGFRVLAALLHGTLVVGFSQTLRRWTEGATYIRQGGHHVGHWPTFIVFTVFQNTVTSLSRYWIRYFSRRSCGTVIPVKLFITSDIRTALQVLIFGSLLICYRSVPILQLPEEWVFPCGYILAFPSGIPGRFD